MPDEGQEALRVGQWIGLQERRGAIGVAIDPVGNGQIEARFGARKSPKPFHCLLGFANQPEGCVSLPGLAIAFPGDFGVVAALEQLGR